jgi:TP901 family phage tail tape measure protein
MGERFNLTAQLQLQAPTNTRQVISQIRSQLQGVTVDVRVEANTRTLSQVNRSLSDINGSARNAATSFGFLNRNLSEAARRFGVITLATGTMLSFAQAVKRAVGDAIAFERQMVTLSQVTGNTVKQLEGVSQEVTRLSTSLGASSKELLNVAITLAQAGFSAEETRKSLDILAKTTLGPSFEDVTETVEGAIAVIRQFGDEAVAAGGNVKFLESTLDAINSVSKAFAVESSDLITVIRRTGGVFAAAGGSVNELIALFTSVRATTRESAETIATGLRTIFTRIQRTETVQQLESLGISLRDAEGRFVGAFEAVKRLSAGLSALDPRDIRF